MPVERSKPILFSAPMVRAILSDAKTQTRRVVKLPRWAEPGTLEEGADGALAIARVSGCLADVPCPYGSPGDTLWVRETWQTATTPTDRDLSMVRYAADGPVHCEGDEWTWRPSIHMPRWASRITLRVTSVRVERLHAITEDDAAAEGAPRVLALDEEHGRDERGHRIGFEALWREINGDASWDANPWVWRVEFYRRDGEA